MTVAPLALPSSDDAEAWVAARARAGLAEARQLVDALRDSPPGDALEALRRWDEIALILSNVAAAGSLLANVHPDERVRTECERAEVEVDRLVTELRQDRRLYDVFVALDPAGLDPVAGRLLGKTLDDFRRAGVDLEDEARARLAEINERLTVGRAGVRPQHPRRRTHHPGVGRAAGRAAAGLARRAPGRRRRAGVGHDGLSGLGDRPGCSSTTRRYAVT